jgi:hypothetical protein
MATIASLIVDVAANTVKLTQDVDKIQGQLSKVDTFAQNLKTSLAGAFTIGAATAFVSELIDMGDNIQRLADKTSLSIEQVQRLSYVAMQSGVSMDGMVSAVQNLQQRLGSNDAGAVGAMKALGINVESFLALNPYDQFTTIAEAVGKIEDPTARASIQAAIFGKNWKEIAPVIIANIKQLAAEAPVMGDNTTRALAQMDDSLKKFQLTVKVWAAEAYNFFGRVMDMQVAAIYRLVGGLYDATARVVELASKIPGASKVFGDLTDNVDSLRQTALWYSDAAKSMAFQNTVATDATKKLTPEAIAAGKAIREQMEAFKAAESAGKKHTDTTRAATIATRDLKNEIIPAIHYTEGWEGAISSFSERVKLTIPVLEDLPKPVAITSAELELLGRRSSLTMSEMIPAAAKKSVDHLDELARAVSQLSQIAGGAFSGIAQSIGTVIGALDAAHKGMNQIKAIDWKNGSTWEGILSTTTGIMGIVSAAIAATKAIFDLFNNHHGRDLVIDFADNLGGFDALHASLLQGGAAGEALWIKLTQGVGKNNPEQAKQVIAEVQRFLDALGNTKVSPEIDVQVNYPDSMPSEPPDNSPGYASGTPGLGFVNFGARKPIWAHGDEAIIPRSKVGDLAGQIAAAMGGGGGDSEIHVYIGNEELDGRIVKVARKDAATGGLRTRVTAGRSY